MTNNIRVLRPVVTSAPAEVPIPPPPAWWNKDAPPLHFSRTEYPRRKLTLADEALDPSAMLTIEHDSAYAPDRPWKVSWRRMHQDGPRSSEVFGRFHLSSMQVEMMFGTDDKELNAIADLGVVMSAHVSGAYVREGMYLNVPAPAVPGYYGSSISLGITEEIRDAVRWLLNQS